MSECFLQSNWVQVPLQSLPKYIETKVLTTCVYFAQSLFLKNKKRSRTSLLASFSASFLKKNIFSRYNLLMDQILIVWLPLLLEIFGSMCIVFICFLVDNIINFEINLSFLIKPFPTLPKTTVLQFKYNNEKKLLRQNNFLSFSDNIHWKKENQLFFGRWNSGFVFLWNLKTAMDIYWNRCAAENAA